MKLDARRRTPKQGECGDGGLVPAIGFCESADHTGQLLVQALKVGCRRGRCYT